MTAHILAIAFFLLCLAGVAAFAVLDAVADSRPSHLPRRG